MTRIELETPEVAGQVVTVRWRVTPPTPLYRTSSFRLRFPDGLDLARVPPAVWWTVAVACLHPHWPLLRPCQVRLPVRLQPGEGEVWQRLLDTAVATLESLRGTARLDREIELVEDGPAVESRALPDSDRCAAAFSGGKDSLLQAGLLTELTRQPILVTTTSPMPPLHDHATARRRDVLRGIVARRDVTLVEVQSDYRGIWTNDFPATLGYPVAVNELTDTFLYFGALLAVAVTLGAPHLFLASEAEVQENAALDGRTVQHPHFMYSTVTQRALQALLRPAGIRYGSLTSPLYSAQVQQLLWTRYPDLRILQYSCWQVRPGEAACSRCAQCFRLALGVLALDEDPGAMGIDLTRLLRAKRHWRPKPSASDARAPLPGRAVGAVLEGHMLRAIRATPIRRVAARLLGARPSAVLDPQRWLAVLAYARLRHGLAAYSAGPPPGFRAGFLSLIDPLLRAPVARIFAEHFSAEEEAGYAGVLSRGHALVRWITEPVGGDG